jgi:hypothetical protein
MSQQVFEGTWEEIVRHSDELAGKRVRLTVLGEPLLAHEGESSTEERPLSLLLDGLIGVIDSSEGGTFPLERSAYGEVLVEKFRKQGLRLP